MINKENKKEMKMKMRIKRNQKCPCGSDKKYKKCCMNTSNKNLYMNTPHDVIVGKHINHINPKDNEKTIWRTSYKNLPKNLVTEIDEFIDNNKIKERYCWYNSHNLSLSINGVSVVNGYYGWDTNQMLQKSQVRKEKKLFQEYIEKVKNECEKRKMRFVRVSSTFTYDYVSDIHWFRHSWNKYGDTHFDLTTELDNRKDSYLHLSNGNKPWIHFSEVETFDTSSMKNIQSVEGKNMKEVYQDFINETIEEDDGNDVLNF